MGIVIRRSGYAAFISYLGFFIGYVNTLWLLPYAFRPEEIGLIRLILAIAVMFATLFSFGGLQIATRFFPYFAELLPRRIVFTRRLIGLALLGAVVFFISFILFHRTIADIYSDKSPLLLSYLWFILPITISLIIYGLLEALVIVQGHPLVPTLLRDVYTRLIITIAAIFFVTVFVSLSGFLSIVCILYCAAPVLLLIYGFKEHILPIMGESGIISREEMKEILPFGAFMFLGNAGAVVLANMDSVVLSAYAGLASTGIYGIAMVIAVVIEIPKRSLSQVLIPLVVKANKEHDIRTLKILYQKSSLNQFIIGAALFLVVWLNIDAIFSFIPNGRIYSEGKWVVLWISCAKLYDMITGINAEIIGTSKYYKTDLLIFFILNLVGVSLNFLFIPRYGLNGAACAVFASVFLYNTMRFIFIAIVMKIQPFTIKTFAAGICVLCTYGIVALIPQANIALVDILVRTASIGIVFGGLILGFHISEDLSQTFHKLLIRFHFHE